MKKIRRSIYLIIGLFAMSFISCNLDSEDVSTPRMAFVGNGVTVQTVRVDDLPEGVVVVNDMTKEDVFALLQEQAELIGKAFPKSKIIKGSKNGLSLLKTRSENTPATKPDSTIVIPNPPASGYETKTTYIDLLLSIVTSFEWHDLLGEITMDSWIETEWIVQSWELKGGKASWSTNDRGNIIEYSITGRSSIGIPNPLGGDWIDIITKTVEFEDTYEFNDAGQEGGTDGTGGTGEGDGTGGWQ